MRLESADEESSTVIPGPMTTSRTWRVVHAALGALSGAAAGGIGIVLMTPFAPPPAVAIGGLATLGAVAGYRWGRRAHAAIWNAFISVGPGA